jgi:hypothetical protein
VVRAIPFVPCEQRRASVLRDSLGYRPGGVARRGSGKGEKWLLRSYSTGERDGDWTRHQHWPQNGRGGAPGLGAEGSGGELTVSLPARLFGVPTSTQKTGCEIQVKAAEGRSRGFWNVCVVAESP